MLDLGSWIITGCCWDPFLHRCLQGEHLPEHRQASVDEDLRLGDEDRGPEGSAEGGCWCSSENEQNRQGGQQMGVY